MENDYKQGYEDAIQLIAKAQGKTEDEIRNSIAKYITEKEPLWHKSK